MRDSDLARDINEIRKNRTDDDEDHDIIRALMQSEIDEKDRQLKEKDEEILKLTEMVK